MTVKLIDMAGVGKAFGGVPVLIDVGFHVDEGEVVALLGANGAGKSTLMKILSGIYTADTGVISVGGTTTTIRTPSDAVALGVRMLPQELSIFPDLTVAENIMIGALPVKGVRVDRKALEQRATALLARMGLDWLSPKTRMGSLSHHVQRIVEIARAMAGNARVLIMDEPTASLADTEVRMLFEIVRRLRGQGISIVYISHYLKEVFEISDRVVVLRDGRNAGDFVTADTNVEAVLEAILGNRLGDIYPPFAGGAASNMHPTEIRGLSVENWLQNIDFSLPSGRITGVHGLVGSGVEMIGRALFGAVPGARIGALKVAGRPVSIRNPRDGLAAGLGLVAAERKREGIVPMLSLRENMSLSNLRRFTKGAVIDRSAERKSVGDWIKRLTIRARDAEQTIGTLSGGNQQKVCLARWLLGDLKVLILEEPTRGVDVGARQEIYRHIRQLSDQGLAILLISSDAEEVAGLADRTIVVAGGVVAARFETPTDAARLMSAASRPDLVAAA